MSKIHQHDACVFQKGLCGNQNKKKTNLLHRRVDRKENNIIIFMYSIYKFLLKIAFSHFLRRIFQLFDVKSFTSPLLIDL